MQESWVYKPEKPHRAQEKDFSTPLRLLSENIHTGIGRLDDLDSHDDFAARLYFTAEELYKKVEKNFIRMMGNSGVNLHAYQDKALLTYRILQTKITKLIEELSEQIYEVERFLDCLGSNHFFNTVTNAINDSFDEILQQITLSLDAWHSFGGQGQSMVFETVPVRVF
jgi:hypothetical protein